MKGKRIPANGSVFLVPLPTTGFGIGVLVRADGKGRAYGVFFESRVADANGVGDLSRLQLADAVLRCRFGDYGLHTQRWPVIGSIPNWDASPWPMPNFAREHDNPEICYVSEYDDNLDLLSETIVQTAATHELPEDVQLGSGIVEIKLDKLVTPYRGRR